MKSIKRTASILFILILYGVSTAFAQITPEKYYSPSLIKRLNIDSCIIVKVNKDSVRRRDMVIGYDHKRNVMSFYDQFNGSRIVFKYGEDSLLLVQEFYINSSGKEENAGMDSFFYDSKGNKLAYRSIVKRKKGDIDIRIQYTYVNDTLKKEEYRLGGDVLKTVYHSYDRKNNTRLELTVSERESNTNHFYQYDAKGKLIRFFALDSKGDTSIVHIYRYDAKGRNVETRTFDKRSNVSNIYKTYYSSNGLIVKEEEFLNIQFGDLSTAIYTRKDYRYKFGKQ